VILSRVFPERFNGSRCAIISGLEVDPGRKNSRERTKVAGPALTRIVGLGNIRYVSLQTLHHDPNGVNEAQHCRRRQYLDSDVMACIRL